MPIDKKDTLSIFELRQVSQNVYFMESDADVTTSTLQVRSVEIERPGRGTIDSQNVYLAR